MIIQMRLTWTDLNWLEMRLTADFRGLESLGGFLSATAILIDLRMIFVGIKYYIIGFRHLALTTHHL